MPNYGWLYRWTVRTEARDKTLPRQERRKLWIKFCPMHDAAPDMLAALRYARYDLENMMHTTSRRKVELAIARAEGR
jgi:hypothetical protein